MLDYEKMIKIHHRELWEEWQAFSFLDKPEEDIYTKEDGGPIEEKEKQGSPCP